MVLERHAKTIIGFLVVESKGRDTPYLSVDHATYLYNFLKYLEMVNINRESLVQIEHGDKLRVQRLHSGHH